MAMVPQFNVHGIHHCLFITSSCFANHVSYNTRRMKNIEYRVS